MKTDKKMLLTIAAVATTLTAISLTLQVAHAEPGLTTAAQTNSLDLTGLEKRYFGRVYEKDATDKRIQRIELLVFGATQDGGMIERLDRLQKAAADHAKNSKANGAQGADTASISALEKKILKKSFDSETPAQRLARLESKVFGQPSPSMSIGDRVFRLKKILNIETPAISKLPPYFDGPAGGNRGGTIAPFSKTTPHSGNSMSPFGGGSMSPFGGGTMSPFGGSALSPFGDDTMSPFGGFAYAPFAGGRGDEITQQMNEMMKQLSKSLRGIHRLPDGAPNMAPFGGPGGIRPFGESFRRGTIPPQNRDNELPPYLDPNSI